MAKIDDTVFTAQIKAVNTILQLCYTLQDYVKSLIEQGNDNVDDIGDISNTISTIQDTIGDIQSTLTNLENNKLNKVSTPSEIMQAYVKQPNGNQQMINVHWNSNADTIPIRDQTGNIRVALTPTNNSHATSKQYTDTGDLFENIKDSNGHNRFVEGSVYTVFNTGMGYTYTKWSLSGTHLMIVVAGQTTSDIVGFSNYEELFRVYLPEWMLNKISIWYQNLVDTKTMIFKNASTGANAHTVTLQVLKDTTCLKIQNLNAITLSADKQYRVQFDLLIDNSNS